MRSVRLSVVLVLAAVAAASPRRVRAQASDYELLQNFSGLLNQIRVNYADSVSMQHLMRGAIEGMLGSLDPHSYFLAHAVSERLEAWEAGHLAWTGIRVEEVEGQIEVLAVEAGSSAERAQVHPGDRITAVNDSSVAGMTAQAVQARLVGERGSKVRLRLERGPRLEPDTVTITIKNADTPTRSVTLERRLPGGVGYVRLDEFYADAGKELRDAIGRVTDGPDSARRLILDLRGNPGGRLSAAVDVLSSFLSKGQMAFRTKGRHPDANHEFPIERDGRYRAAPLVLLIDEHSASASEATAGSLQDHDRAFIMGRRSFGKALVQSPFLILPGADVAWLTIAYVYTPAGRLIQRRYEGLNKAQYYALAGKGGTAADTILEYRTDSGRVVRGGGGIAPDSVLPTPPELPTWFVAASDSGLEDAVSDSAAQALPRDTAAAAAWRGDPARWAQLLPPLEDRARRRLGVTARADSAQGARIARAMAARGAEVRWGAQARDALLLASDPEVAAAAAYLSRPRRASAPR